LKKTVLVLSAAVALSVMTAPVALAQDDASCDAAKANVTKLQKRLDDEAAEERVREKDAVKAAKDARDAAKTLRDTRQANLDKEMEKPNNDAAIKSAEAALKLAEDALTARKADLEKAQEKQAKDSDKVISLRSQVEDAVADRDKVCGGVTTTPTPTPTPEPENDVDCDEVSDDEAQRILNADRSDPNNLDQDNDGVACEVDEILPESDNDDGDGGDVTVNNNVAVPQGGVSTGVGPRDS